MKIQLGLNDDYAIVHNESYEDYFYYGYEETIGEDEWCFVVHENCKEVFRLSTSELIKQCPGLGSGDEPERFLLVGMYIYSQKK